MNPAVILMDMQEYFLRNGTTRQRNILVSSQLEILTYCAQTNVPVIVVEYKLDVPEKTIDVLLDKIQSVPRNRTTIKSTDNAMLSSRPNVRRLLRSFEVDYLVLMGVNASSCVKSTASTASSKYNIGTSRDIIGDIVSGGMCSSHMPEDNTLDKIPFPLYLSLFYKNKGDFFNTHKELITYLEEIR